jgi:hypothetical protein
MTTGSKVEPDASRFTAKENAMYTILLVLLILLVLGALPAWPYSRSWGYYPSGGLGILLVILIVLMLTRV